MIHAIYVIILIYFLFGGLGFYIINRKKDHVTARKSYLKFATYFLIINLLFFSITIHPVVFRYIGAFIVVGGFLELFKLFSKSGYKRQVFFILSIIIFSILALGFILFTGLNQELILFSFLVLSIFDSFSQITGQLWGKRKIFPITSPNKTVGGLIGGSLVAIASGVLLNTLYPGPFFKLAFMSAGIAFFAFLGDIIASYYKRKYDAKDYNNLIPGHGGILDRFDSLIAGGAWVTLSTYLLSI